MPEFDGPVKDPAAVLDYAFDWGEWLQSGETITAHAVAADGVTVDSDARAGGVVTVWASGGTSPGYASIRCQVTTSAGRTDERSAVLRIRDR